jgi:ubiquinone/menaquinone biosynthesis C-methylase UbiE
MNDKLVSDSLQKMYDNYYGESSLQSKRHIAALQTYKHILKCCKDIQVEKILDVGAGEGSLLEQMSIHNFAQDLYGVEISESGCQTIREKNIPNLIDILKFDGYKIPYPDKYFDLAISIHVLEHVEHERQFLYELKRVAKNVLIEIPLEHTFWVDKAINVSGKYGHINFYTTDIFTNLLKTCGYHIEHFEVFAHSKEYEQFLSGNLKGYLKYLTRQALLKYFPKFATYLMTYVSMALCIDNDV